VVGVFLLCGLETFSPIERLPSLFRLSAQRTARLNGLGELLIEIFFALPEFGVWVLSLFRRKFSFPSPLFAEAPCTPWSRLSANSSPYYPFSSLLQWSATFFAFRLRFFFALWLPQTRAA